MNSLELFVFLQKNMTSMKKVELKSVILECQMEELSAEDRQLVEQAIEATSRSYAPYSHFHVGAAVRLENGKTVIGCNQENRDCVRSAPPCLLPEPSILTLPSRCSPLPPEAPTEN